MGEKGHCVMHYSTFIDPDTRQAMGEQAVALSKAVGYDSAGMFAVRVGFTAYTSLSHCQL